MYFLGLLWELSEDRLNVQRLFYNYCYYYIPIPNWIFFFEIIYLFLDRGEGRKREKETSMCGCLSCAPYWGPGPQPRHLPWLGIEPATHWFTGWHSIHWATPARAYIKLFNICFSSDYESNICLLWKNRKIQEYIEESSSIISRPR